MRGVGILAYGSLISDPGIEIGPQIAQRVPATTPFPVEYARLSRTRGGAPTVVPYSSGNPVNAEVLVLLDSVKLPEAKRLLWRRETRNEHTGKLYPARNSPKAVVGALSRTPLGRVGEPDEVARVAVFLASEDSSYITGQTIYPDGGRLALNYTVPVPEP
jgi:hypothetical protein